MKRGVLFIGFIGFLLAYLITTLIPTSPPMILDRAVGIILWCFIALLFVLLLAQKD